MVDSTDFHNEGLVGGEEQISVAPEFNAGNTTAQAVHNATAAAAAGNSFVAPEVTCSILDYARNNFDVPSGLSAAGADFINALIDDLSNATKNNSNPYWTGISVLRLPTPKDSIAVVRKNHAIILIMAESNVVNSHYPVVNKEKLAIDATVKLIDGCVVDEVIVISPDDYGRVAHWSASIRSLFSAIFNPVKATTAMFDNVFISVSDNPNDFERAFAALSPHGVPLRHDLTLVIYGQNRNNQNRQNPNQYAVESRDYWNSAEEQERIPLAAVSGYVEFVRDIASLNADYKFYPVVHINEVVTLFADGRLLPLCISYATKYWIIGKTWLSYYSANTLDAHGNGVNIGYLFPDGNGGRCRITSNDSFIKTVYSQFHPAQLVIDVPEGRFRCTSLAKYSTNRTETRNEVINDYCEFFGLNGNPNQPRYDSSISGEPYAVSHVRYSGFYMYGNKVLDIANIDFMSEYPRHPEDAAKCENLLFRKQEPTDAVDELLKFEPDLKLLYRTEVISLNSNFVAWLDGLVPNLNVVPGAQLNGYASINNVAANAQQWGTLLSHPQSGCANTQFFNTADYIYGGHY